MLSVGFGNTPCLKKTKNVSISKKKKKLCLYALKYLNFGTKNGIKGSSICSQNCKMRLFTVIFKHCVLVWNLEKDKEETNFCGLQG